MPIRNKELHRMLHVLWTKGVGTPDYIKSEWILLEQLILDLQKQANDDSPEPSPAVVVAHVEKPILPAMEEESLTVEDILKRYLALLQPLNEDALKRVKLSKQMVVILDSESFIWVKNALLSFLDELESEGKGAMKRGRLLWFIVMIFLVAIALLFPALLVLWLVRGLQLKRRGDFESK